jgi:hypothetical protein
MQSIERIVKSEKLRVKSWLGEADPEPFFTLHSSLLTATLALL